MFAESVSYPAAFVAGLFSFLAPCILPLLPAYFTFISGYSLEELTESPQAALRSKVILSTISYVLGFSLVFILLGASATYLGGLINTHSAYIRIIGGALIVLLGAHLIGLVRLPALEVEKRIRVTRKPLHFLGAFVIGMAFGVGWSPCIGPLLGSILIVAGNQETIAQGVVLLALYSAGLAVPFIVMSIFINYMLVFLKRFTKALRYMNKAAGLLLILVGLSLMVNKLAI